MQAEREAQRASETHIPTLFTHSPRKRSASQSSSQHTPHTSGAASRANANQSSHTQGNAQIPAQMLAVMRGSPPKDTRGNNNTMHKDAQREKLTIGELTNDAQSLSPSPSHSRSLSRSPSRSPSVHTKSDAKSTGNPVHEVFLSLNSLLEAL